ncbi:MULTISPECIES: hypothetical protein [Chryseobacterium]|uniref:hypothetical protein n=1 Tax=Chryseobacterium sp. R2A-55 TaxID=2744445 RepID=UPI001F32DABB|nr:hypothetical protein [Chryseobacterium sp. R2A-55]
MRWEERVGFDSGSYRRSGGAEGGVGVLEWFVGTGRDLFNRLILNGLTAEMSVSLSKSLRCAFSTEGTFLCCLSAGGIGGPVSMPVEDGVVKT